MGIQLENPDTEVLEVFGFSLIPSGGFESLSHRKPPALPQNNCIFPPAFNQKNLPPLRVPLLRPAQRSCLGVPLRLSLDPCFSLGARKLPLAVSFPENNHSQQNK